jgi:hypothetical protein
MTSIRFMALWLSLVLATLSYAAPPRAQGGAFRMDTKEPVEVEEFVVNGREVLLEACRERLPAMRLKYPKSPPDGFLIFDGAAEVGRWLGANASPRIAM